MARETKRRLVGREQVDIAGAGVRSQVAARPVDQTVTPARDQELLGLIEGLSVINPELRRAAAAADREELEAGMRARQAGGVLPDDANSRFAYGYELIDSQVKGAADGSQLDAKYNTEFDKDNGDVEAFISQTYQNLTKGLDGVALKGHMEGFSSFADKIRKEQNEYLRTKVMETNDANVLQKMTLEAAPFIESMDDPSTTEEQRKQLMVDLNAKLDPLRQFVKTNNGFDGKKWNETVFTMVHNAAMEGNPEVLDLLEMDRPDGTPALANIPAYRLRIDQTRRAAEAVRVDKVNKAEAAIRKQREERQDKVLYDAFVLAYNGDIEGANRLFKQSVDTGLFTHASELFEWDGKFRQMSKREDSEADELVATNALADIYTGRIKSVRDILRLDLSASKKRQLLTDFRTMQTQERTLANSEAASEKAIYRHPTFTPLKDNIRKTLLGPRDPLDFGENAFAIQQLTAAAELDFVQRAAQAKDPSELAKIQSEVVNNFSKMIAPYDARLNTPSGTIKYRTPREAVAAFDRGELTDYEFSVHETYFKQKRDKELNGK